jgi:hypothetical protein
MFNRRNAQRIGRAIRQTERSNPPSTGPDYPPRRGMLGTDVKEMYVSVAKTGGADGDDTVPSVATWVYDIYLFGTGTRIAAKVPLYTLRLLTQQTTPGTTGRVLYVASNAIVGPNTTANVPPGFSQYGEAINSDGSADTTFTKFQPWRLMWVDESYPGTMC